MDCRSHNLTCRELQTHFYFSQIEYILTTRLRCAKNGSHHLGSSRGDDSKTYLIIIILSRKISLNFHDYREHKVCFFYW